MRVGRQRSTTQGYAVVALLVLVAVSSYGLALVGPLWADQAQRARERQLIRVGTLYAEALAAYRAASPGSLKQYPKDLASLTLDSRFVGTVRWIRQAYPDPLDGTTPWGLVRNERQEIVGVYSQNLRAPLARTPMTSAGITLPIAQHYAEWKFIAKEAP